MGEMSAAMREFTRRAGTTELTLQQCGACGSVQWPPREICHACLSDALEWRVVEPSGVILSETILHTSLDEFFRNRLPWRVGTVRLDAGPVAYAHLHARVGASDAARIEAHEDHQGRGVLIALPIDFGTLTDDPKLFDLVSKGRNK